jgi:hypothetical protein
MLKFMGKHASTVVVATVTAAVMAAAPVVASTIVDHARFADNAGKLGGKKPGKYLLKTQTAANALHATTADTANSLPALSWTNLTLSNGWAQYGTVTTYGGVPAFTKDHEGFVHLTGVLSGASKTSNFAFTLPAGFRPPNGAWVVAGDSNGSFNPNGVNVYIASTGVADILPMPGANLSFVSLEGIEFYVG